MYLPSVGLVLLFGLAVKYLWSRSRSVTIALSLLLAVVCIALNLSQQNPYENEKAYNTRSLIVDELPPEKFAEMMIKWAVEDCKHGEYERARELLKPPPSTVAFYRISSETLFLARSFDVRRLDYMTYVTPEGVQGTVPYDDLDLRVTACLNPEMVGTLLAKVPAPATTAP